MIFKMYSTDDEFDYAQVTGLVEGISYTQWCTFYNNDGGDKY